MDAPKEVRGLIDQLGQALVQAIISDTAGQDLIKQIQETGFEVGIMLEATVALHHKDKDIDIDLDMDGQEEVSDNEAMEIAEALAKYFSRDNPRFARRREPEESIESLRNFEWSDEDKAMMCNFRIRLD